MRSVLFVCSANICRSPMAMGLLKEKVKDEAHEWQIASAGVWALADYPVDQNVVSVLLERGIDLGDHRSTQVTEELISHFSLVLTMERNHKEALRVAFPKYRSRIYLVTEMVDEKTDIADPIGGARLDFEATAIELQDILTRGSDRIRALSRGAEGENARQ